MLKKRTPAYVYVIILIIIALLLYGQSRDGKLLPEVEKQFSHMLPSTSIAINENAFVAMAGFNSNTPEQMIPTGNKAIQQAITQIKNTPYEYNLTFTPPDEHTLSTIYALPCNINLTNEDCLSKIKSQTQEINRLLKESTSFINNYLALQTYTQFANILPVSINGSVPYQYIRSISELLTAKAVLDINAGNIEQGMQFLLKDIAFYRLLLNSQERNLEDTVTFTNRLQQHYLIINNLLHAGIDLQPYLNELTPLLNPLSKTEKSLVYPLVNERNFQLFTMAALAHFYYYTGDTPLGGCYNNSCSSARYFSRLFYHFNDTLNAIYLDWQPTINFAKKDVPFNANYVESLKELQQVERNHHIMTTYRLYERYGLFLYRNNGGEKHKNSLYFKEGYTMYFVKIYVLDETILLLNKAIKQSY